MIVKSLGFQQLKSFRRFSPELRRPFLARAPGLSGNSGIGGGMQCSSKNLRLSHL
jgi:hypothetical protein